MAKKRAKSAPEDPTSRESDKPEVAAHGDEFDNPFQVSRPLAAFRLGHLGMTIRMWLELFRNEPNALGVEFGVPVSVRHLQEARLALAGDMAGNVFSGLPTILERFTMVNQALFLVWERQVVEALPEGAGQEVWNDLRTLCEQALPEAHRLRPLFEFGRELGAYQVALYDHPFEAD
jgi:hypothetical protein